MNKTATKEAQLRAMRERRSGTVRLVEPKPKTVTVLPRDAERIEPVGAAPPRRPVSAPTAPPPDECPNCKIKDARIAELEAALAITDAQIADRRAAKTASQKAWRRNRKAKKEQDR